MAIAFRHACEQDAKRICDIYRYYVENTVATFRTVNIHVEEYEHKIKEAVYPFWVAEENGSLMGFAYAERLRPHEAYIWDVELTIYLRKDAPKRSGIGSGLFQRLLDDLAKQGFRNAYSAITGSNQSSIDFHKHFGFTQVAHFFRMGYKHGAWHDVIWMNKVLGRFDDVPELPEPFRNDKAIHGKK